MKIYSVIHVITLISMMMIALVIVSITLLFTIWFDKERIVVHKVISVFGRLIFQLSIFWRVRIEGFEKIDTKKVYVITVNHQSMVDIPLMHYLSKIHFKWVSKHEVFKIPIIGFALGMRGDIAIRRGQTSATKDLMEKGKQHLKNGCSIIVFPEGTRSKNGEVHMYKEGAFRLAKANNVEILPCVIEGTRNAINNLVFYPAKFTIRVLSPISVEEVQNTETRDMAKRVQQLTKDNLQDIREKEKSGK